MIRALSLRWLALILVGLNRSQEAEHWNLLTDMKAENLRHASF